MKPRRIIVSILVVILVALAGAYWFLREREVPGGSPLQAVAVDEKPVATKATARKAVKSLDVRAEILPQNLASRDDARAARVKAVERLAGMVRGVKVDFDEVLGSPKWIGSTDALLTGAGGSGGAVPEARAAEFGPDVAHRTVKAFLAEHAALFGHGPEVLGEASFARDYTTPHNGLRTTVWQQRFDGLRVFESTLQAHVTKDGALVNVASRMVPNAAAAAKAGTPNAAAMRQQPPVDARRAVSEAAKTVGEDQPVEQVGLAQIQEGSRVQYRASKLLDVSAEQVWLPLDETSMRLCWEVIFKSKKRGEMFLAVVDAESGKPLVLHGLTNYISPASYRVWTSDSPSPLSPGHATQLSTQPPVVARTLVTLDALDTTASPNGWIDDGVNELRGNNVDAHTDTDANDVADLPRPVGSPSRVFDFPIDLAQAPSTYRPAAVADLFYWNNLTHDRLYQYGFTEAAGNFQNNNFGRGGVGNDAVQADAQDGSGTDNANFSTPPDGSPGRMQMYVFTGPTPDRDGDFDHEIVIHEYAHGLSNRLVGGGVGMSALQSRGMGEGWSDFYGLGMLSEPGDAVNANYAVGGYATFQLSGLTSNYYSGIRRYPYSTDVLKNPLTFKDIDPGQASAHTGIPISPVIGGGGATEVHNQGEVWCVALWDVRANLIAALGATAGNEMVLRLVTDGMKLAPANPNMLQARDAIIQADLVLNAGANRLRIWTGFAKRGMGANATSPASSTTTGLVENYDLPDDLGVTPATGFVARGNAGGPFDVTSTAFTLRNNGAASLNWTASVNVAWLNLVNTSGSLVPAATATSTASLNAAANALADGLYTGTVTFTNTVSGIVQTRVCTLRVGQKDYFTEVFDTSVNDTENQTFLFTPNSSPSFYRASRAVATSFPTDPAGGTALTLTDDSFATVVLTGGATAKIYGASHGTIYVGSNGYVTFTSGDTTLTNSASAHFSQKRISALMDDLLPTTGQVTWKQTADRVAVTWLNVREFGVTNLNSFQIEMYFDGRIRITILGIDAAGGVIGLSNGGGIPVDFAESDFSAYGPEAFLTLAVPAVGAENFSSGNGTVTANPAPTTALTVALTSNDTTEATVPATVVIAAGQTSAAFAISYVNDTILDGTQTVTIGAAATGYVGTSASLPVNDNETATLTVSAPATATEGDAPLTGAVTSSAAVGANITVALSSSDSTEITVPATVTILSGQASVTFPITIVNDNRLDGPLDTSITASVANWTSGSATISVADNDLATITLSLPATVREGNAPATGTVTLGGSSETGVVVLLSSNDTTELTVPASVTVLAGQLSATFSATIINDPDADGAQPVVITANTEDYGSATANVSVADNDAHHFNFAPIANPQVPNAPIAITVSARDVNDAVITNYNATVPLTAAGSAGAITITPTTLTSWVSGVFSGNVTFTAAATNVVLTANDGQGHAGVSNAFDVVIGPPHHFVWDTIPSPQYVDAPFPVTVRAVDAGGNSTPSFTGTANLDSVSGSGLGQTVGTGTTPWGIPFYGGAHDGRNQMIYLASELGGARTITGLSINVAGTSSSVFNNFTIRLKTTTLSSFATPSFEATGWTEVHRSNVTPSASGAVSFQFSTPFIYDGTSNLMLDLSCDNAALGLDATTLYTSTTTSRLVYGFDNSTLGDPRTWSGGVASAALFSGIQNVTFLSAASSALPVTPSTTGAFVAGQWTGNVTVPVTGSIALRATSGALTGNSNTFVVNNATLPPTGGATVFAEDFESGVFSSAWTLTGTGNFRTQITTYAPHGGTRHMAMDEALDSGSYARNEATLTLNLAGRTGVHLAFWAADFNDEAEGPPASPFPSTGANFDGVAISADGGVNWYEVQELRTFTTTYAAVDVNLDTAIAAHGLSYTANFKIRFNQYDNFSLGTDGIGIDDILVTANALTSPLTVTLPAQTTEGAGGITGSVSVTTAPGSPLVLNLTSKSPAKITVPATVTIPAGQTSANFPLTVLDDTFIDGPKNVIITAAGGSFAERGGAILVVDNDGGALTVSLPATANEADGTITGTVTASVQALVPLTVTLSTSNTLAATPPATVTLPAGELSVSFTANVADTVIDGTQTATVTASIPGWINGTASVQVADDEPQILSLAAMADAVEGSTAVGSVSVGGNLGIAIVVTLSSSDPSQYTVPATVTIPAGQSSVAFVGTAVDDALTDGNQTVVITATAPSFTSATTNATARDNDLHHFGFSAIAPMQIVGIPFSVTITAKTVDETTIAGFTSTAALSSGVAITPASTTPFAGGIWTGNITCTTSGTNVVLTATNGAVASTSGVFAVQTPPSIVVAPSSITLTVDPGLTTTRTLAISNTGDAALSWDLTGAGPTTASAHLTSLAAVSLQVALTNLNAGNAAIRAAIPGRFAFTGGVTGTSIVDGGSDMFDTGNIHSVNASAALPYSDNVIIPSALLGTGGQYFTRKYEGLWILGADVAGLTSFQISGGLGADGGGITNTAVLTAVRGGKTYKGFVKRVYSAGDPSVNRLLIVEDNGSVSQIASTNTDSDSHQLINLTGVTRIYSILFARTAGGFIDNTAVTAIMSAVLDAVGGPSWITASTVSGTVAGSTTQNVTLTFDTVGLALGNYTQTLVITSNDIAHPTINVPLNFTVANTGFLTVTPAQGFNSIGGAGGPFNPPSKTFTVSNTGALPFDWTASKAGAWLDLSLTNGTLAPGETAEVVATLNANALALGNYPLDVVFTNTTNERGTTTRAGALDVVPRGQLVVGPADNITAIGPVGGPFNMSRETYTLTNTGDAPLDWEFSSDVGWVMLSSNGGTLAAGELETVTVIVGAPDIVAGNFHGTISFVNVTDNSRGNTNRTVDVEMIFGLPYYQMPYVSGAPVPNLIGDPRIPADAVWVSVGSPSISDHSVSFVGQWASKGVRGSGIFLDNTLVVKVGEEVPSLSGVTWSRFNPPVLSGIGQTLVVATIRGPGVNSSNDSVVASTISGAFDIIAREGDLAPNANGARFQRFNSAATLPDGIIQIDATLLLGSGIPAVTNQNNTGAWRYDSTALGELIFRTGAHIPAVMNPGDTLRKFVFLKSTVNSPGQGRGAAGDKADFLAHWTLSSGRQYATHGSSLGISIIADTGLPLGSTSLPGATWSTFGQPSASYNYGHMVMGGTLRNGGTAFNVRGIFTNTANEPAWEPFARAGEPAVGFGTGSFHSFRDPVHAAEGQGFAFLGTARGTGITTQDDTGIWWKSDAGTLSLVARENDQPPGAPVGAQWKSFDSVALPGNNVGPIFTARLKQNVGGISGADDFALYGTSADGVVRELIRENQTLLGRTVRTFSVLGAAVGSPGVTRTFSNHARVGVLVTYADRSTGILIIQLQ